MTMLPQGAKLGLRNALNRSCLLHDIALKEGISHVDMPYALAKKYLSAGMEKAWQFIFASNNLSIDPITKN
jgi:hypothetical protein